MTAVTSEVPTPRWSSRRAAAAELPPLHAPLYLVRALLVGVALLTVGLLLQLVVVSALQQRSNQQQLFADFRLQLAEGTAPLGPVDIEGRALSLGSPVAYLEIPELDLRQVVVEGTTSGALVHGPGHRRDTVLPGQAGVSIIAGRRAAYGGPFAGIDGLEAGDEIRVTTGQGEFEYEVLGVRREGDQLPQPPRSGEGRLVLATADGTPLLPNGVVRVDAELRSDTVPGARPLFTSASLPGAEDFLGGDTSSLWALALWLQALLVLALGAVWAWHRWGRAQAWIVFLPALLLVSVYVANQTAQLLPNVM